MAATAEAGTTRQAGTPMREINFSTGMPDPGTFPSAALGEAAQRVILREGTSLCRYPDPRGYVPLREVAVERFRHNHQRAVPVSDVVLTTGSMQAIILATQALSRPGDTAVVEGFCYSGTLGVLRQYGLNLQGVALDEDGMRIDALDETLTRLAAEGKRVAFVYTIATHQNPTGSIMPATRRRQLLEVCRKHHVLVLEDDCYADVLFEGEVPRAIYADAQPGEVIYLGSFSKILGPGVRLGYFIAPEALTTQLLAFKRDGGTNALASMVVAEYMKDHLWSHVKDVCDAVRHKRDVLFESLRRELGDLVDFTRPRGGLFSWVRLPEDIDTAAIAQLAKERGLTYGTGRAFDPADRDVKFLRLAFGFVDADLIAEGVALLGECIEGAAPGSRR